MNTYSIHATINQTNVMTINLLIFGDIVWNYLAMH